MRSLFLVLLEFMGLHNGNSYYIVLSGTHLVIVSMYHDGTGRQPVGSDKLSLGGSKEIKSRDLITFFVDMVLVLYLRDKSLTSFRFYSFAGSGYGVVRGYYQETFYCA